jgi:C_GCAxxG_C_C family probable redox protein
MAIRQTPSEFAAQAETAFRQGLSCAQATAVVFANACGLEAADVRRMMAGLGGGVGGLRQTCGAVIAMAWVAGLRMGGHSAGDLAAKTALYDTIQRMRAELVDRHGSDCCRELLERAGVAPDATPSARTTDYYAARPCPALVASGAEIIARTLFPPT